MIFCFKGNVDRVWNAVIHLQSLRKIHSTVMFWAKMLYGYHKTHTVMLSSNPGKKCRTILPNKVIGSKKVKTQFFCHFFANNFFHMSPFATFSTDSKSA